MSPLKYITYSIFFFSAVLSIFFSHDTKPVFEIGALLLVNCIIIVAEYIVTTRKIEYQYALSKDFLPIQLKDLIQIVVVITIYMVGFHLLLKWFNPHFELYLLVQIISILIQYMIIKDKKTGTFLIDRTCLIVNEVWVKKYDLKRLQSITLNGFTDRYVVRFNDSKKLEINPGSYSPNELNNFLAAMCKISKHEVVLSDNIADEINAAQPFIGPSNFMY
jgi:hypothetical protein